MRKISLQSMVTFVLLLFATPAFAISYGFNHIVENGDGPSQLANGAVGEAQLSLDVETYGDKVLFTFSNEGSEASSITDVYFDDDAPLLLFSEFRYTGMVLFSEGAAPSDLPGGNLVSFSSDYAFDSVSPAQPNGVNPGESLGIVFTMSGGADFDDIIAALNDFSLAVGIHVQGFADDGSESFVNSPVPVPEPATLFLLGGGLWGVLGICRKRFFS